MAATHSQSLGIAGRLPRLDFTWRPSGVDLAVAALPTGRAPFTLARVIVPIGGSTSPDQHEVREVWLIERGSGVLTVDGQVTPVHPGDIHYFESQQQHQIDNTAPVPLEITSIWWQP